MDYYKKILPWIVPAIIIVLLWRFFFAKKNIPTPQATQAPQSQQSAQSPAALSPSAQQPSPAPKITQPIGNALSRVTKKPFGIKVSPGHSPVSPERFSGYHTGADFETAPEEQTTDVPIFAVCDGPLALKKYASGYGGVMVQSCKLQGIDATVIYGHLRLSSITPSQGQNLSAGEQIAVLGTGYSQETDGERRHLHLGIHKGTGIDLLGYVQNPADLNNWIDPLSLLK